MSGAANTPAPKLRPLPSAADRAAFRLSLEALHSPAAKEICAMVGHDFADGAIGCVICVRCTHQQFL